MCDSVAVVVSRRGEGVAVEGFLGTAWIASPRAVRSELDKAIQGGDAEALHRLNPEFAPAWCPTCRRSYCRKHWRTEVAGADDHPGWYDATYGTCPGGHRRKLDD